MLTPLLIALIAGYLLGSLPFGYLVARSHGVNIFEVGSKSPGATNVRRVLGRGPGNLVFALDALKGAAAVAVPIAYFWFGHEATAADAGARIGPREAAKVVALIAALLGHSFSCFTRFRGGKGVATGAGGLAVLFPWGALIAFAIWLLVLLVTRYVSVASILAAMSLPGSALFLHQGRLIVAACAAVAIIVIVRHRGNLARLIAGTENKIGQKRADAASSAAASQTGGTKS